MRIRYIGVFKLLCMAFIGFVLLRCEPEYQSSNSRLSFNCDTLVLDTTFAYLGGITNKQLRLNNGSKHNTNGVSLRLAGGAQSKYIINVNGLSGTFFENLTLRANDSMYVFVQIKPFDFPASTNNGIHIVTDSIIIESGPFVRKVVLSTPIIHADIKSGLVFDEVWQSNRYILVAEDVIIPNGHKLTVESGSNVNFSANTALIVEGSMVVTGECAYPTVFRGHRYDYLTPSTHYTKVPNQWKGILIKSGSNSNMFSHCFIQNAIIGVQIGEPGGEVGELTLKNCRFNYNGISNVNGYNATLSLFNCVLSNSINQLLLFGGNVTMVHTTIANYNEWNLSKTGFALYLTDADESGVDYSFSAINIYNSIIYGSNNEEVFVSSEDILNSFDIKSSIIKSDYFNNNIPNKTPIFRNLANYEYDFRLIKNSPAIDAGGDIGVFVQEYDFLCNTRDLKPDIGAYEFINEE